MRCNIARSIAGVGGSVVVGTYTGNGTTTERNITLPVTPTALLLHELVLSSDPNNVVLLQGDRVTYDYAGDEIKLSGNKLIVKGVNAMGSYYGFNKSNQKYNYIAFT